MIFRERGGKMQTVIDDREVFLTHEGVTVWRHYKHLVGGGRRALEMWYSTCDSGFDFDAFYLWDLGIGGTSDIGRDLGICEQHDLWVEAVKTELRLLISEGIIRSGVKPARVTDSHLTAQYFSMGGRYGRKSWEEVLPSEQLNPIY